MSDLSWLNPTPLNRCVRFAPNVASGHATLATKRTLLLTWAGLAPAGSRQLCLAHHSLNHLVSRLQEWLRDGEAKRFRSLEIDYEFVFGRLLDRQVTGFGTFEDTIDIASSLPEHVSFVRSIRNQPAVSRKKRKIVHCRQA